MLIEDLIRAKGGALHFTLIDPDRQTADELFGRVRRCAEYGTDAIMVGGSSSFAPRLLDETVRTIKAAVDLPVILFPNSAATLSRYADYIFFMSLLNADDPRFLIREQAAAAPILGRSGLRPISMAYIVISTSRRPTSIERRAKRDVLGPGDDAKILGYALAGQYLGLSCVYLEAGSGADRPVPLRVIRAVKEKLRVPLIVGGGIRSAERAAAIARAGADVIVTGTIAEQSLPKLKSIIRALRGPRRRS